MSKSTQRIRDVSFGTNVRVMDFVNLYGCAIGDETFVGPFVEVQDRVRIGRRCKIQSHSFICSGTVIEDEVFVGHHVTFTNDRHPRATTLAGERKKDADWVLEPATVEKRASIGSGAVILPGVRIGAGALVGAGAVVTKDVRRGATVAGNPAREHGGLPSDSAHVRMFDPQAEYAAIRREVDEAIAGVLRSGRFVGGPEVEAFETEFGDAIGGMPVAAVGSGTDALRLSLGALGVGPGDEVIIPANTFTATAMAVEAAGATPVVCDVDERLYVMTAATIEPLITPATKALIPVHLYGHPAPMPEIMDLARASGLIVLEDAAQAHGAAVESRPAGTFGDAAAFSFYPSKNLGAYGDGGAVVGSEYVVRHVRRGRDLGRDDAGNHTVLGTNSRLDALQAALLRVKLRHLRTWVEQRRAVADRYRALLSNLPIGLPEEATWARHSYHLYVIRVPRRDDVKSALTANGIDTGIHYPHPIHHQPAHKDHVKVPGATPVAERLAGEILSLPLHPYLTEQQQDRSVSALHHALRSRA